MVPDPIIVIIKAIIYLFNSLTKISVEPLLATQR